MTAIERSMVNRRIADQRAMLEYWVDRERYNGERDAAMWRERLAQQVLAYEAQGRFTEAGLKQLGEIESIRTRPFYITKEGDRHERTSQGGSRRSGGLYARANRSHQKDNRPARYNG